MIRRSMAEAQLDSYRANFSSDIKQYLPLESRSALIQVILYEYPMYPCHLGNLCTLFQGMINYTHWHKKTFSSASEWGLSEI